MEATDNVNATDNMNSNENTESINYLVEMIVRQTTLSEKEAAEKLKEHNFDYVKVIEEFMGIDKRKKVQSKTLSVNQQIYKEIRTVMDDGAFNYYNKK
jgi:hypothetical protein